MHLPLEPLIMTLASDNANLEAASTLARTKYMYTRQPYP